MFILDRLENNWQEVPSQWHQRWKGGKGKEGCLSSCAGFRRTWNVHWVTRQRAWDVTVIMLFCFIYRTLLKVEFWWILNFKNLKTFLNELYINKFIFKINYKYVVLTWHVTLILLLKCGTSPLVFVYVLDSFISGHWVYSVCLGT